MTDNPATPDALPPDPPDPLTLTPARYLAGGLADARGRVRPEHLGFHAYAAAMQFQAAAVPLQELAAIHAALAQTLPLTAGPMRARLELALGEALDLVGRMLGTDTSAAIEDWLAACLQVVHDARDLAAFLAHFQAVVRQYGALLSLPPSAP